MVATGGVLVTLVASALPVFLPEQLERYPFVLELLMDPCKIRLGIGWTLPDFWRIKPPLQVGIVQIVW
jgi:hypothetical protein